MMTPQQQAAALDVIENITIPFEPVDIIPLPGEDDGSFFDEDNMIVNEPYHDPYFTSSTTMEPSANVTLLTAFEEEEDILIPEPDTQENILNFFTVLAILASIILVVAALVYCIYHMERYHKVATVMDTEDDEEQQKQQQAKNKNLEIVPECSSTHALGEGLDWSDKAAAVMPEPPMMILTDDDDTSLSRSNSQQEDDLEDVDLEGGDTGNNKKEMGGTMNRTISA